MSIGDILTQIASVVSTAAGLEAQAIAGGALPTISCHVERRTFDDQASLLYALVDTSRRGGRMVHGWELDSRVVSDAQTSTSLGVRYRTHEISVHGYYECDDPETGTINTSRVNFRRIIEAVSTALCTAIEVSYPLSSTAAQATHPTQEAMDQIEVGGRHIYHVLLRLTATERLRS